MTELSKSAADWRDNGEAMYLTAILLEAEGFSHVGEISRPGASWKTCGEMNRYQMVYNCAERCFGVKLDLEQVKAVCGFVHMGYLARLDQCTALEDLQSVQRVWGSRLVQLRSLLWFDQERASEEDNDRRDEK